MSSVTQRIKEIKQPKGGYLKPSEFRVVDINDGKELNSEENVHSSVIGMVVDYMSRYMTGTNLAKAFNISIMGAAVAEKIGREGSIKEIDSYLSRIKGLDNESIINACKIVTFDVWFRNTPAALIAKTAKETAPDNDTIENIRIMIERSICFFDQYGPIKADGFTFEGGGYTDIVDSGDGDFLTSDTLWDFKVSKSGLKSDQTLQLLMYYIMGKKSGKSEFNKINKIGVFNPRTNKIYVIDIKNINSDIIDEVSQKVIGYQVLKKNNTSNNYSIDEQRRNNMINNDEYLDITDIMKRLRCSRYKVMKLYTEQGLPLLKMKNKYYVSERKLNIWIEKQRKKRMVATIVTIILLVVLLLCFLFLIK